MSTGAWESAQPEAAEGSLSFLDRAIEATTQTPADTTKNCFSVLTEQALWHGIRYGIRTLQRPLKTQSHKLTKSCLNSYLKSCNRKTYKKAWVLGVVYKNS